MADTAIRRHFVTVKGRQVHYRRAGSGPPVVMLHMSPSWAKALDPFTRIFAEHFTAIALDTPGYGYSDLLPLAKPEIPDSADALRDTIDALGIKQCGVFGSHTGASIAMEFALRYPERVRTLTLMCTSCGGPQSFGYQEMVELSATLTSEEDWASIQTPERMQEALLTSFTPEFLATPNEMFQQTVMTTMQFPPTITGIRGQNAAILAHDTYDRLPQIKAPTLVMTGADDGLLDPRNSPLLAERIPGAELRMFDGVRHGFNLEAADEVNAALLAFLGKHSAVAAA